MSTERKEHNPRSRTLESVIWLLVVAVLIFTNLVLSARISNLHDFVSTRSYGALEIDSSQAEMLSRHNGRIVDLLGRVSALESALCVPEAEPRLAPEMGVPFEQASEKLYTERLYDG